MFSAEHTLDVHGHFLVSEFVHWLCIGNMWQFVNQLFPEYTGMKNYLDCVL